MTASRTFEAPSSEELIGRLKAGGYQVTPARRAGIELILSHEDPFTSADLVAEAKQHGWATARATIFRTLDLLMGLAAIERLDMPDGEHAYIVCRTGHHHHVVCTRCGRSHSIELAGGGMSEVLAQATAQTNFILERHRLEIFGLCPACQQANTGEGPLYA